MALSRKDIIELEEYIGLLTNFSQKDDEALNDEEFDDSVPKSFIAAWKAKVSADLKLREEFENIGGKL